MAKEKWRCFISFKLSCLRLKVTTLLIISTVCFLFILKASDFASLNNLNFFVVEGLKDPLKDKPNFVSWQTYNSSLSESEKDGVLAQVHHSFILSHLRTRLSQDEGQQLAGVGSNYTYNANDAAGNQNDVSIQRMNSAEETFSFSLNNDHKMKREKNRLALLTMQIKPSSKSSKIVDSNIIKKDNFTRVARTNIEHSKGSSDYYGVNLKDLEKASFVNIDLNNKYQHGREDNDEGASFDKKSNSHIRTQKRSSRDFLADPAAKRTEAKADDSLRVSFIANKTTLESKGNHGQGESELAKKASKGNHGQAESELAKKASKGNHGQAESELAKKVSKGNHGQAESELAKKVSLSFNKSSNEAAEASVAPNKNLHFSHSFHETPDDSSHGDPPKASFMANSSSPEHSTYGNGGGGMFKFVGNFIEERSLLFLKAAAMLSAVVMQITPISTILLISRAQCTGDLDGLPYIMLLFSSCLWMIYGILRVDAIIILPNIAGLLLGVWYVHTYHMYCNNSKYRKGLDNYYKICFIVALTLFIIFFFLGRNLVTYIVGLTSAFFNVISYGSPLAALRVVIKDKSTASMPAEVSIGNFVCSALWLSYGFVVYDIFVIIPNFLGSIVGLVQLVLLAVYPSFKGTGGGVGMFRSRRNFFFGERSDCQKALRSKSGAPQYTACAEDSQAALTGSVVENPGFNTLIHDNFSCGSKIEETINNASSPKGRDFPFRFSQHTQCSTHLNMNKKKIAYDSTASTSPISSPFYTASNQPISNHEYHNEKPVNFSLNQNFEEECMD